MSDFTRRVYTKAKSAMLQYLHNYLFEMDLVSKEKLALSIYPVPLHNFQSSFLKLFPLLEKIICAVSKRMRLTLLRCRYFSRFQYCRYALHVRRCEPNGDGISSFNNLLDLLLLRACVWIVAFVTCIGNASVVLFRILFKDEHRVHSLFIKNLCSKCFTFTLL